jgi:hypothetical protein
VASAPSGIDCGATCVASYPTGTVVKLNALPAAGAAFAGWSGAGCAGTGPCYVTLMSNAGVTAELVAAGPLAACSEAALRSAITEAVTGDVIVLPSGCTITLTGAADDYLNLSGDLDISPVTTAATKLTIRGGGPLTTTIDGGAVDRVFDIAGPGLDVTLEDLTIRNGDATWNVAESKLGGGILVQDATLTLRRVVITGSRASDGGGLFASNATVTLEQVTLGENTATTGVGGGAAFDGEARVENSTISDNHATTDGGGVFHGGGPLTVRSATIASNTAGARGGGLDSPGGAVLTNTILAGNTAATGPDCAGAIDGSTNDLIQSHDPSACVIATSAGDQLNQPAELGPLRNNGGGMPTRMPEAGSLALDRGSSSDCPAIDQRGRARPGYGACDIGAVEVRPAIFADVPPTSPFWPYVEDLATAGVASGCGAGSYCPDAPVTREQMAVFLIKADSGPAFTPPPCTASPFSDMSCGDAFARWVRELVARGVTAGCAAGSYCPTSPVTREQMAVFLLKTLEGPSFAPPACATAAFADVPCSSPFAPWIQELVRRGITAGCGAGTYCPGAPVTRAQMAVFILRTFGLAF